jgi:hypothetical protein
MITPDDILKRLETEYPKGSFRLSRTRIYFGDSCTLEMKTRTTELIEKARLFNAHLALEHIAEDKRNWWKKV